MHFFVVSYEIVFVAESFFAARPRTRMGFFFGVSQDVLGPSMLTRKFLGAVFARVRFFAGVDADVNVQAMFAHEFSSARAAFKRALSGVHAKVLG